MNEPTKSQEVLHILLNEYKELDELALLIMTKLPPTARTVRCSYEIALECIIAKRSIEAQHHEAGWAQTRAAVERMREEGAR
jgi:hypothetical protein